MVMFHLLKTRTSVDIFKNEKCKVTFGLEYTCFFSGERSLPFGLLVAICDQVHDVETIFHLSYVLTTSGNLF